MIIKQHQITSFGREETEGDTTYRTDESNQEHSDVQIILRKTKDAKRRTDRSFYPNDTISGMCVSSGRQSELLFHSSYT